MRYLLKLVGLAAVIAAGAGPMATLASAESFEVEFHIDSSESASATYVRARRTAHDACDTVKTPWLGAWVIERACELDLLDNFIIRAGRADLAREHHQRTGRLVGWQNAARTEGAP